MLDRNDELEMRIGCCADQRKPCSYHEGFLDGMEHAGVITAAKLQERLKRLRTDNGDRDQEARLRKADGIAEAIQVIEEQLTAGWTEQEAPDRIRRWTRDETAASPTQGEPT